jgi:hypothetical protein
VETGTIANILKVNLSDRMEGMPRLSRIKGFIMLSIRDLRYESQIHSRIKLKSFIGVIYILIHELGKVIAN